MIRSLSHITQVSGRTRRHVRVRNRPGRARAAAQDKTTRPPVGAGQIYARHGLLWSELWAPRRKIDFSACRCVKQSLSLRKYSSRGRKSERSFWGVLISVQGVSMVRFSARALCEHFSRAAPTRQPSAPQYWTWGTRLNNIYIHAYTLSTGSFVCCGRVFAARGSLGILNNLDNFQKWHGAWNLHGLNKGTKCKWRMRYFPKQWSSLSLH